MSPDSVTLAVEIGAEMGAKTATFVQFPIEQHEPLIGLVQQCPRVAATDRAPGIEDLRTAFPGLYDNFDLPSDAQIEEVDDRGAVVDTHLWRDSQPMIRFAPGDETYLATDPCPCGRTYVPDLGRSSASWCARPARSTS
ncbi:hypothetical protein ACVGVM_29650 (plasmid) [Pseudonocardia bannensis]|uniref:hypothetical protein n=1 Tax=Pseudonocardia TaxID=1847 RepID=UPI001FE4A427|nr:MULTISPECIES: hypothetical protein [Pseudonocardia]